MNRSLIVSITCSILFASLIGCGGLSSAPGLTTTPAPTPDSGNEEFEAVEVDLSFCDARITVAGGELCAIKPSSLDPRTKDVAENVPTQEKAFGFGYHVVAVPKMVNKSKGIWVHFSGSFGRPYDQNKKTFPSKTWLAELLEQGYVVVQPAYDNNKSIGETCKNEGINDDDCSGKAFDEVKTGIDRSNYRQTDYYNGVLYRLESVLKFVAGKQDFPLPAELNPASLDLSKISLSGHSQGGNMAYHFAKYSLVKFACMLGAPFEPDDNINKGSDDIADWFRNGAAVTPTSRLGHLVTVEDTYYGLFRKGALFIGLTYGVNAFETKQAPYYNSEGELMPDGNGAHGASVGDPKLKPLRASACFR